MHGMYTTPLPQLGRYRASRRWRRATVVAVATVGAAATWIVARALEVDLVIDPVSGQQLDILTTSFATLIAGLAGWAGLAALERVTRYAVPIWSVVALVIVAASFVPVFQVSVASGTLVMLLVWHAISGVVILGGLLFTSVGQRRRSGQEQRH